MDPFDRPEVIAHVSTNSKKYSSPGPAAYNIRTKFGEDVPPIKFRGRHSSTTEVNPAPYHKIPSSFGNVTKITMHSRSQSRDASTTIGPSYIPPRFGAGSRMSSFAPPMKSSQARGDGGSSASRLSRTDKALTPGPGPAAYDTRDRTFSRAGSRGYTIKGAHDFQYANSVSPGPGAYKPRFEKVLPSSPKVAFHIRPKDPDPKETPGYRNLGSTLGGVAFTMKSRKDDDIHVM